LDGPDFQKLTERARFLFIVIKMNAGPVGLETEYESAAVAKFAEQTGMPTRAVRAGLKQLEGAGWIERELNVLRIIGHLDHEPSISSNDEKHRKSVQRYVSGLPRLAIVARFIRAHANWFPVTEAQAHGLGWAMGAPSEGASEVLATTENREPRTKDREPRTDGAVRATAIESAPAGSPELDRLRARFETESDRLALDELPALVNDVDAYVAELHASLDGMAGHHHTTRGQAGRAVRDFVAKLIAKKVEPSIQLFRGYLKHAASARNGSPTASAGLGELNYLAGRAALEDL
jgi:hypothetical protein